MPQVSRARSGQTPLAALLLAILLATLSWSTTAAQEGEEPELTWAPLVTPPPLVVPPISSPTDQVDGFSMGSLDAPVVVEVWEDFQCPFCQRFTYEIKPLIVEQYVQAGDARLVFRNLAFLGDESHWAAVAASLAADQNMFWPFHDYLFANYQGNESGAFRIEGLLKMAEAIGLDMDEFKQGLVLENARARFAELQAEAMAEAYTKGINATPTVVVNGTPLESPDFASVSDAIDIELAKVATAAGNGDDATEDEGPAGDE
jgi:protein-disulfide isomerase